MTGATATATATSTATAQREMIQEKEEAILSKADRGIERGFWQTNPAPAQKGFEIAKKTRHPC